MLLVSTWGLCASGSLAAPAAAVHADTSANKAYCGVRCLYAAALKEGVNLSAADVMRPEYIGSREGSSIEELDLAAREHGLHTLAFINGTVGTLRSSTHPVILHVESTPGTARYDHFVLYFGERDHRPLILDTTINPGEPAHEVNPRDLELIWDGAGIIVSKDPIESQHLSISCWALVASIIVIVGIVLAAHLKPLLMRLSLVPRIPSLGVVGEALILFTIALLAPALSALCAGSGLLTDQAQVEQVEQTHRAYFLPRISFATSAKQVSAGLAVFVDARYAADYGSGHLPGAINVPVSSSTLTVRLLMGNVAKNTPVIVYCQSKACPFAKTVATALLQLGYTSVQLLDGGWEEWCAWKR